MIVGIDLGTSNTSAAVLVDGSLNLVPNDRGQRTTPSVIACLKDGRILVGEGALNQAVLFPQAMIRESKRYMGTGKVFDTPQGGVSPGDAAFTLLSRMRKLVSDYLFQDVRKAVIAVPAHFGHRARQETMDAARRAGWDVIRLLNEPSAAALQYLSKAKEKCRVLVYDFGGGTFDASLVAREGDRIRVLACSGDEHLGGRDLDEKLALHAWKKATGQQGLPQDPGLRWRLLRSAEACKIDLSCEESASMAIPDPDGSSRDIPLVLGREDFESLILPGIERSLDLCRDLMGRARLEASGLDGILLSGGTSRIPLVRRLLNRDFPDLELTGLNPDEAVALGAAWYGHLHEQGQAFRLEEVASFDLGVLVEDKDFYPLITRDTLIPTRSMQTFTTLSPGQEEAEIRILQRDGELRTLGALDLRDLKTGKTGEPKIRVSFSLDENEMLRVEARDVHGHACKMRILHASGNQTQEEVLEIRRRHLEDEIRAAIATPDIPVSLGKHLASKLKELGKPLSSGEIDTLEEQMSFLFDEVEEWKVQAK